MRLVSLGRGFSVEVGEKGDARRGVGRRGRRVAVPLLIIAHLARRLGIGLKARASPESPATLVTSDGRQRVAVERRGRYAALASIPTIMLFADRTKTPPVIESPPPKASTRTDSTRTDWSTEDRFLGSYQAVVVVSSSQPTHQTPSLAVEQ